MALILTRRRWLQQPQQQLTIDWNHPLARGLIFSTWNAAADAQGMNNYAWFDSGYTRVGSGPRAVAVRDCVVPAFNGSDDWTVSGPHLSPYRQVTLGFWLWVNTATQDRTWVVYSSTTYSRIKITNTSGVLVFNVLSSVSGFSGQSIFEPAAGRWHYYLVGMDTTVSGSGAMPFVDVDGVPISPLATSSNFVATPFASNNMYFMTDAGASPYLAGKLRNVSAHSRLLDVGERREMYRNPWQFLTPRRRRIWVAPPSIPYVAHRFQLST